MLGLRSWLAGPLCGTYSWNKRISGLIRLGAKMTEKPFLVTAEQANDLALWAKPETVFEKYLQDALKRLTLAVQMRDRDNML